jgi:predicted HAD superfamily Cof-like phosphohydrolase
MTEREMVEEFHKAMGLPVRTVPTMPSEAERLMRARLIHEESRESIRALGCEVVSGDEGPVVIVDKESIPRLNEVAHELNDLLYVAHGGLAEMGAPPAIFSEIHRANMSKLDDNGRPVLREDGKVMKGPNYRPPDVARVLARVTEPALDARCTRCGASYGIHKKDGRRVAWDGYAEVVLCVAFQFAGAP